MNADDMERLADSLGDRFQDQIRAVRVSRLEAAQVVIRQAASDRAVLERVREALTWHPTCDVHPDDVVTCGWKKAVASITWALRDEQEAGSR